MSNPERRRSRRNSVEEHNTSGGTAGKIVRRILIVLFLLAFLAVAGIYIYGMYYFRDRFFRNTTINGFDVSEMNVEQVEEKIAAVIEAYKIDILERGDVTETITADQIDYHYVSKGEVQAFKNGQKLYEWPLYLKNSISYTFESSSQYNEELLQNVCNSLDCFNAEKVVKPVDAYIDFVDGQYQVIKEIEGNLLDEDTAKQLIQNGIDMTQSSVNFEESNCYKKPMVRQDDTVLNETTDKLNTCISTDLTYIFGDHTEKVDAEKVRQWLSFDDDGNVELDEESIRGFVRSMADKYDTLGKPREFVTQSGATVTVDGCDYGWQMDQDATADYLIDAIWAGNTGETYAEFLQTAVSWYNSDLGSDYVEIDLGSQHLWLFIDNQVVVSSDFVSGLAGDPARYTPEGTYTLYYKESPSVLKGENGEYETKVTYWMPFNGGIGMHDATWRKSFGGNIYLSDGSHGCVNLPLNAAKEIYENVYDGIPIICYY